jgi:hypothetical protein
MKCLQYEKIRKNIFSYFWISLKYPKFVCRNYFFINDFNVLQKVPEKQGQIGPWSLCLGLKIFLFR